MDELLLPVLQAHDQRTSQLRMDQFLSFSQRFAKIRSKRLQTTINKITGEQRGGEGGEGCLPVAVAHGA